MSDVRGGLSVRCWRRGRRRPSSIYTKPLFLCAGVQSGLLPGSAAAHLEWGSYRPHSADQRHEEPVGQGDQEQAQNPEDRWWQQEKEEVLTPREEVRGRGRWEVKGRRKGEPGEE